MTTTFTYLNMSKSLSVIPRQHFTVVLPLLCCQVKKTSARDELLEMTAKKQLSISQITIICGVMQNMVIGTTRLPR